MSKEWQEKRTYGTQIEVAELRAENERLRGVLESLTEKCVTSDDFGSECIHCGGKWHRGRNREDGQYIPGRIIHNEFCPYVEAKRILADDE